MLTSTLDSNEIISKDMFVVFCKSVFIFSDVLKKGYEETLTKNKYDIDIVNQHFGTYKKNLESFISKVKKHYQGERVEYTYSEVSLLSAISYIYSKQNDINTQILGYIFNNDVFNNYIFEEANDDFDKNRGLLYLFENLVRSMTKKIF